MPTKTAKTAPKNNPLSMFLRPKPIKLITKKVLKQIADSIHDPESGRYLNLCAGTLQNGPDPVCETRTMHCGLGELYFVVTGHQPEEDHVREDGVIYTVTERSTIGEQKKAAIKAIKKAKLSRDLEEHLLQEAEDWDYNYEETFRDLLDTIPDENDIGDDVTKDFAARAKRVAKVLREAAELLPR
jgi:hypothetical protein